MGHYKEQKEERDLLLKSQIELEAKLYYEQFNKINREAFCKANKRSSSTIRRLFGSWNDFLRACDIPINMNKNVTKEQVIESMRELYKKHGKLTAEIQRSESPYSQVVIDNLFGSFGLMLKEIEMEHARVYQKYSDEELLDDLKRIQKECGYVNSQLIQQIGIASYQTYVSRFGTTAQAVQQAGLIYGYQEHGYSSKEADRVISIIAEILDEQPHTEFGFEWLRGKNNSVLPVDSYFEKSNLIVEYHGIYHYHHTPFMHGKKSLQDVQETDKLKREEILKRGFHYIEYAYNEPKTFDYIFRKLKKELDFKVVTK